MVAANSTAPVLTEKRIAQFWAKIDRRGPDECWPWRGRPHGHGYGYFGVGAKKLRAHVLARFLATNEWPAGRETCHSCDSRYPGGDATYRLCCNPAHLWLGTHADNMADMVAKGRNRANQVRGERQGSAKLTAEQVIEMRRLHAAGGVTLATLGARFDTTLTNVHNIVNRISWRHVP